MSAYPQQSDITPDDFFRLREQAVSQGRASVEAEVRQRQAKLGSTLSRAEKVSGKPVGDISPDDFFSTRPQAIARSPKPQPVRGASSLFKPAKLGAQAEVTGDAPHQAGRASIPNQQPKFENPFASSAAFERASQPRPQHEVGFNEPLSKPMTFLDKIKMQEGNDARAVQYVADEQQAKAEHQRRRATVRSRLKAVIGAATGIPPQYVPDVVSETAADIGGGLTSTVGSAISGEARPSVFNPLKSLALQIPGAQEMVDNTVGRVGRGLQRRGGEVTDLAGAPDGIRRDIGRSVGSLAPLLLARNPLAVGAVTYDEARGQGASEGEAIKEGVISGVSVGAMGGAAKVINRMLPGTGVIASGGRFAGRALANKIISAEINEGFPDLWNSIKEQRLPRSSDITDTEREVRRRRRLNEFIMGSGFAAMPHGVEPIRERAPRISPREMYEAQRAAEEQQVPVYLPVKPTEPSVESAIAQGIGARQPLQSPRLVKRGRIGAEVMNETGDIQSGRVHSNVGAVRGGQRDARNSLQATQGSAQESTESGREVRNAGTGSTEVGNRDISAGNRVRGQAGTTPETVDVTPKGTFNRTESPQSVSPQELGRTKGATPNAPETLELSPAEMNEFDRFVKDKTTQTVTPQGETGLEGMNATPIIGKEQTRVSPDSLRATRSRDAGQPRKATEGSQPAAPISRIAKTVATVKPSTPQNHSVKPESDSLLSAIQKLRFSNQTQEGADLAKYLAVKEGGRVGMIDNSRLPNGERRGIDNHLIPELQTAHFDIKDANDLYEKVRQEQNGKPVYSTAYDHDAAAMRGLQAHLEANHPPEIQQPILTLAEAINKHAEFGELGDRIAHGEATDAEIKHFAEIGAYELNLDLDAIESFIETHENTKLAQGRGKELGAQEGEQGERQAQRGAVRDAAAQEGDVDVRGLDNQPRSVTQGLEPEAAAHSNVPRRDKAFLESPARTDYIHDTLDRLTERAKDTKRTLTSLVDEHLSQPALPGQESTALTPQEATLARSLAQQYDAARSSRRAPVKESQSSLLETGPTLESKAMQAADVESQQGKALANSPLFEGKKEKPYLADNQGAPLTVYHGTLTPGFDVFDSARFNSRSQGEAGSRDAFFFSRKTESADAYASDVGSNKRGGIYSANLRAENPLHLEKSPTAADIKRAKDEGYDAIITPYEYAVFEPSQIEVTSKNVHHSQLQPRADDGKSAPPQPHEMTRAEFDQSLTDRRRESIIRYNASGGKGFPPALGVDTPRERIRLSEAAGLDPRNTLNMGIHELHIRAALKRGDAVRPEVLADYPDLVTHHSQTQSRDDEGKFALEEKPVEPAKGSHGQFINALFKSPDVDAQIPAFWANPEVRAKLGLPRTGPMSQTKDALAKAMGLPRSSHISPEQLRQWASDNGLGQDALTALDAGEAQYRAKLAMLEARKTREGGFIRFGGRGASKQGDLGDLAEDIANSPGVNEVKVGGKSYKPSQSGKDKAMNDRFIRLMDAEMAAKKAAGEEISPDLLKTYYQAKAAKYGSDDPIDGVFGDRSHIPLGEAAKAVQSDWEDFDPIAPKRDKAGEKDKLLSLRTLDSWMKANMLMGLSPYSHKVGSLLSNVAAEEAARPFTAAVDYVRSKATGTERAQLEDVRGMLNAAGEAVTTGAKEAWQIFRHGATEAQMEEFGKPNELNTRNPVVNAMVNYTFRAFKAGAHIPGMYHYTRAMNMQARVKALSEARTGKISRSEVNDRVVDILDGKGVSEGEQALMEGNALLAYADGVFQSDNALNNLRRKVIDAGGPKWAFTVNRVVPFMKSASNAYLKMLDYTGVGPKGAAAETYRAVSRKARSGEAFKSEADRRTFAQAWGKLPVGVALFAAGVALHRNGLMTSLIYHHDDNPQPGSVTIGGKLVDVARYSPIGLIMAAGATFDELTGSKGQDPLTAGVLTAGEGATNLPMFQQTTDLIKTAQELATGKTTVPGVISATAKAVVTRTLPTMIPGYATARDIKKGIEQSDKYFAGPLGKVLHVQNQIQAPRSQAEVKAANTVKAHMPQGGDFTPEKRERYDLKKQILDLAKKGQMDEAVRALADGLKSGKLAESDAADIDERTKLDYLQYQVKKLSAQDALSIYFDKRTTPTEREKIADIIEDKLNKYDTRKHPQREVDALMPQVLEFVKSRPAPQAQK